MNYIPSTTGDFIRWAIVLIVLLAGIRRIRHSRRLRTTAKWRVEAEAYRRAVTKHEAKMREGDRTWNS